jgi:hypothetical protein
VTNERAKCCDHPDILPRETAPGAENPQMYGVYVFSFNFETINSSRSSEITLLAPSLGGHFLPFSVPVRGTPYSVVPPYTVRG